MRNFLLLAADSKIDPGNIPKLDANTVLVNGLNVFYFVVGIIAVIAIILAGLRFTISQGDPEAIKKAKNTILYAVIGIVVIGMAAAITQFIYRSLR